MAAQVPYQILPPSDSLLADTNDLYRESCELNEAFVSMFRRICSKLESRLTQAVGYIVVYLLARLRPLSPVASAKLERSAAIAHRNSVEFCQFLNLHLSWFNFEILEALVGVFLRADAKASYQLVAYRERLKEYGMATLCEVARAEVRFGLAEAPDALPLSVLVDHTYTNCHFHDMHHLRKTLSTALGRKHCPLYLSTIEMADSGMLLSFLLPEMLHDDLFPIKEQNMTVLRQARIIRVECGGYVWEEPLAKVRTVGVRQLVLSDIDDPLWFENNSTPLHMASWQGIMEEVEWLVRNVGYKALKRGLYGWSPLHAASYGGHFQIVTFLLSESHCTPATVDDDNVTALHVACFKGHTHIVTFFTTEKQVSPTVTDAWDGTPIHYAVEGGQLEVVKFLVEELGCSLTEKNAFGANPFLLACQQPHVSLLKYILNATQGSPLVTDKLNQGALHYAACSNSTAVVRYLEKVMGSEFNLLACDDFGLTPFHYAAGFGSLDLVSKLAEHLQGSILTSSLSGSSTIISIFTSSFWPGSQVETRLLSSKFRRCLYSFIRPLRLVTSTWNPDMARQHRELACFLLQFFQGKIDLHAKDKEGMTILLHSCGSGNLQLVRTLIEDYKLNPNDTAYDERSAMSMAAFSGSIPLLVYLKEQHQLTVKHVDVHGRSLLHHACLGGSLSAVQYLVEKEKLDCRHMSLDKGTAFHSACRHGHFPIAQYLLEEGHVDPRQCLLSNGHTALHTACDSGCMELVEYLLKKGLFNLRAVTSTGYTCLHYACFAGNLTLVKLLVRKQRCDKNATTVDGFTPLHAATHDGRKLVVRYLVEECSIDPKTPSVTGLTPLHLACRNGHKHVVDLLVGKYGCDVNVRNIDDATPIHEACCHGHTAVVDYLASLSDCKSLPLLRNNNCLHLACQAGGKLSLVRYLIEECRYPSNPETPTPNGFKPLHLASEKGHLHIVRYLIESNTTHCDPSSKLTSGLTPLHCAARHGHMEIVRYLTSVHHCNPKEATGQNYTPVDAAIEGENWEIMEYLLKCS